MKVELTKEQIKFIKQLCFNVDIDYENYSPEEQAHRVSLADDIYNALDCDEVSESIDEEKLEIQAAKYVIELDEGGGPGCYDDISMEDAYKAGYRDRAMEEK